MSPVDKVELRIKRIVPPEAGDYATLTFRVTQKNISAAEAGSTLWLEFFSVDGSATHKSLGVVWPKKLSTGPLDWSSYLGFPIEWLDEDIGRDEIIVKVRKLPSPKVNDTSDWVASNQVNAHFGVGEAVS